MKKILLCCLLMILSAKVVMAVDGYKSLKFGMSLEEVKKSKFCAWVDDGAVKLQHAHVIYCADFKFSGKPIMAAAYFIDDKFSRLVLELAYKNLTNILTGLKRKYKISLSPSQQSIDNLSNFPNQEVWYGFDDNTIYLLCRSNKFYQKSLALIYSSPLYEKLLKQKQVNSLKDDL